MAGSVTGATIPYQLRPLKAIERNLFVELLKFLDSSNDIRLNEYRYVGFGAAFLEDFKQLHLTFRMNDMDCIEIDPFAYSRQIFNNPYQFINLCNISSTDYINEDLKSDKSQLVWLDYARPKDLAQQLLDIEILCSKVSVLDIVKFTFNAKIESFISSHGIKDNGRFCNPINTKRILEYLRSNTGLDVYLPAIKSHQQIGNFDELIRAMAVRAINRGLSGISKDLKFMHLSAFTYADGQTMTTITGVICDTTYTAEKILSDTKIRDWEFYKPETENEFIQATEIMAPVMTTSERFEIDRRLTGENAEKIAEELEFKYGSDEDEHQLLVEGYCKFYRYLPYYGKVIY